MRYGFFYGVDGDPKALEAALELLADCDRVISLGDLVGQRGGEGDPCLGWMEGVGGDPRFVFLAGKNERQLGRRETLPASLRHRLKGLPSIEILDGLALVGGAHGCQTKGAEPPLVAPLTLAAGPAGSRLWRASGGLSRVEEVTAPASFPVGGQKMRLDVGKALQGGSEGGRAQVVVVDREAGILEWRSGAAAKAPAQPEVQPRRRPARSRRIHEGQQLLAV